MTLQSGTRLGPYEITAQIGEGGMGEVYRAADTNLGRDVAIKVLPESVAQDPQRLARFDREARMLAALNHPNIAQIHGLEKSAGAIALVMELVEGPTLADRIAQGAIPVDEVLPIAKQIAEALEAAHEQGIIHRDLKPANIKVRADGTVKVLDFGLAKALEPASALGASAGLALSQAPTITTPAMTQAGMILGTAAYMSPEQAKGRTVDKRSDVWAFGAVLYEMLSGKRAFGGDDYF
jgi:serine/threonine protein kinase